MEGTVQGLEGEVIDGLKEYFQLVLCGFQKISKGFYGTHRGIRSCFKCVSRGSRGSLVASKGFYGASGISEALKEVPEGFLRGSRAFLYRVRCSGVSGGFKRYLEVFSTLSGGCLREILSASGTLLKFHGAFEGRGGSSEVYDRSREFQRSSKEIKMSFRGV